MPTPRGSSEAGPHSTICDAEFRSRYTFERATRLCAMSPMMATRRPSSVPRRSRMVRASSSACVGCSCVPSPALMMGIGRWRARKCGAPEAAWRITMASGRMAASVFSVSTSDSPFETLEAGGGDRNRIRAQAFGGDFETGARARGGFEKQIDDHPAAQHIERLERLAWRRLKILGARQDGFDLRAVERFDIQQSRRFMFRRLFRFGHPGARPAAPSPCRRFPGTSLR